MTDEQQQHLKTIQGLADDACLMATNRRLERVEAVNWGNLGCVDVRRWSDISGDEGITVYIEEADPSAYLLQSIIREHLAAHGYPNIEVVTEW
jgi:hypothetical protein